MQIAWWRRARRVGLCGLVWCLVWLAFGAHAAQRFEVAERAEQAWPGLQVVARAGDAGRDVPLPAVQALQAPTDPAAWQPVTLPDAFSRVNSLNVAQAKPVSGIWYRLTIDCLQWQQDRRAKPDEPVMFYIPRAPGGGLHLFAQAAGQSPRLLRDQRGVGADGWNLPAWWATPQELVLKADQACAHPDAASPPRLLLVLPHVQDQAMVLSSAWIGPRDELLWRWSLRMALQQTLPQMLTLGSIVLGVFALMVWRKQRPERIYLLFALCAFVWVFRNLHLWWPVPASAAGAAWFWWVARATVPWFVALTFCFGYSLVPVRYPRVERGLLGLAVALNLFSVPLWSWPLDTTLPEYALLMCAGLGLTAVVTRDAWRPWATGEFRLLAVLFWLGLSMATNDILMVMGWAPAEGVMLVPMITLGFLGAYLFAFHRRYLHALTGLAELNRNLEVRVAQQREDIERSHARLREVEQVEARMNERQRLMRDMHDGVGSTLITALAMIERRPMSSQEVAQVLRECLDDMRMVVDSMEPGSSDLTQLLGNLRHRLGRRLEAAGLRVHWDIPVLAPLPWMQPTEALQLLRLVQEAVSNVIKHAQARNLHVRLVTRDSHLVMQIEDDGVGFTPGGASGGHGLLSMASRARRLGGQLSVDSRPGGGARLQLVLPLERPVAVTAFPQRRVS